jgi:hypothetical protein
VTKEEVFAIWAPAGAAWSAWVKPVLFAHLPGAFEPFEQEPAPIDIRWAPPSDGTCAVVIDLPSAQGVQVGALLAASGYRPIALYNAAPGPRGGTMEWAGQSTVDVWPILDAICGSTPLLARQKLPYAAPPAFMLDSNRRIARGPIVPGRFDNRSVSFPTDFPSANLLLSRGIRRAMLVQLHGNQPEADLAHTLRRWQDAGIEIRVKQLEVPGPAVMCRVGRPSLYRFIWHRLGVLLRLRRNPLGGFGGMLPEASSG